MKAEINILGNLVLTPETSTEVYALSCWDKSSRVDRNSLDDMNMHHYKGENIVIRNDVQWIPDGLPYK